MLPQFLSKKLDKILPFIPLDQKCYFLCLMASYLFSFAYFHFFVLNSRNSRGWQKLKHVYILLVSHLFLLVCFKPIVLVHMYVPIVFTFILVKYFGKRERPTTTPILVFGFVIIHLAIHHLVRQIYFYNEYVLDHTTPMMMMAIKLTTFAFDIIDLEATTKNGSGFTFLEFLGYSFLFPGLLTGPCISFADYCKFINGRYFEGLDLSKPIHGRKRHAGKRFLTSMFFLAIYIVARDFFPCGVVVQDDFLEKPSWHQWLYIHLSNVGWRAKYYFAWLNAEGAYAIIGLGFQKPTPSSNPHWNKIQNVRPLKVEFSADPRQIVSDWNITTNLWLRGCVYKRLGIHQHGSEGKPGFRVSLATYAVSAFWHGFYPGYYLTFISMALVTFFCRLVYKTFTWPLHPILRPLILYVPVFTIINYVTFPFALQTFKESIKFWKNYFFSVHIFLISGIFVLKILNARTKGVLKSKLG